MGDRLYFCVQPYVLLPPGKPLRDESHGMDYESLPRSRETTERPKEAHTPGSGHLASAETVATSAGRRRASRSQAAALFGTGEIHSCCCASRPDSSKQAAIVRANNLRC
jgi:hypothetical protein